MKDASSNRTKQSILSRLSLPSKPCDPSYKSGLHSFGFILCLLYVGSANKYHYYPVRVSFSSIPSVHLLVKEPSDKGLYTAKVCKLPSTGQIPSATCFSK